MLAACPILDVITQIPADEAPLCGNAAVYAIIIIIVIIITTKYFKVPEHTLIVRNM